MTKFNVPDMSCGHCEAAIGKSIMTIDPNARVDCDLTSRIVSVESSLDNEALTSAIKEAGYAATAVTAA